MGWRVVEVMFLGEVGAKRLGCGLEEQDKCEKKEEEKRAKGATTGPGSYIDLLRSREESWE
jgi:hypothetical protein